jgi:predicted lipoprotein with Yx(FWY)xxD motif
MTLTHVTRATAAAAALALVTAVSAAAGPPAGQAAGRTTVKTGHALGMRVLVTPRGRTLYSLSAETHGRFICTTSYCLSLWKPLLIRGRRPTGAPHLGTIRRPDSGKRQVKYRGKPLYSFVQDRKPGDAKGEGFRDVGTWHVARR